MRRRPTCAPRFICRCVDRRAGARARGSGLGARGSGLGARGSGLGAWGLGLGAWGLGLGAWGLGLGAWGLGLGDSGVRAFGRSVSRSVGQPVSRSSCRARAGAPPRHHGRSSRHAVVEIGFVTPATNPASEPYPACVPQFGQKRASAASAAWQRLHALPRCDAPHCAQKRASAALIAPQPAHASWRSGTLPPGLPCASADGCRPQP